MSYISWNYLFKV